MIIYYNHLQLQDNEQNKTSEHGTLDYISNRSLKSLQTPLVMWSCGVKLHHFKLHHDTLTNVYPYTP